MCAYACDWLICYNILQGLNFESELNQINFIKMDSEKLKFVRMLRSIRFHQSGQNENRRFKNTHIQWSPDVYATKYVMVRFYRFLIFTTVQFNYV